MSRPKKRVNLPNFALATEESKRVIAAFQLQNTKVQVATKSVARRNQESSQDSRDLPNHLKRVIR